MVGLDSRSPVESLVSVGLDLVDALAESVVVFEPLFSLVLNLALLHASIDSDQFKSLLSLDAVVVPLGEEEDLDAEQVREHRRLIVDVCSDDLLEASQ